MILCVLFKLMTKDWESKIDSLDEPQAVLVRQLAAIRVIRREIKIKGFVYLGSEDFLLQHGEWFTVRPWSHSGWEGPPKACFQHSLYLAKSEKLSYVEGMALPDCFPMATHHAWNADQAGNVIDGVWRNEGTAYLGVRFPVRMANKIIRTEAAVLDDYKSGYALFRKPWMPEQM